MVNNSDGEMSSTFIPFAVVVLINAGQYSSLILPIKHSHISILVVLLKAFVRVIENNEQYQWGKMIQLFTRAEHVLSQTRIIFSDNMLRYFSSLLKKNNKRISLKI